MYSGRIGRERVSATVEVWGGGAHADAFIVVYMAPRRRAAHGMVNSMLTGRHHPRSDGFANHTPFLPHPHTNHHQPLLAERTRIQLAEF